MESEVVMSPFDNLPKELYTKIFKKLKGKSLSRSMCVSHTWRDLILGTTVPKMPQPYLLTIRLYPYPFLDLQNLFFWCSKVMRCWVSPQQMINSCNGLFLLFHKNGEAEGLRRGAYYYYVINPITKQCIAVLKPTRTTTTTGYSYAALAYDPCNSWYFNIMRFLGCHHVGVFSSRSGQWETMTHNLPQEVVEAHWVKKSVYTKGAIYRLSRSGHLIKFMIGKQETIDEQAVALPLPAACLLKRCHWDISVGCGKLLFVMSLATYIFVFELLESVEGGVVSYNWMKICSINNQNLRDLNFYGELLSYHPYIEMVFFKYKDLLHCYHIAGNNNSDVQTFPNNKILHDYLQKCGLPLFECPINFSCTLNKEPQRVSRWLPIPE